MHRGGQEPAYKAEPVGDASARLVQQPAREVLRQRLALERGELVVDLNDGILVLDDTTLDKPYAEKIDLVTPHWSGKHHDVVLGINLITTLWTDVRQSHPSVLRRNLGEGVD